MQRSFTILLPAVAAVALGADAAAQSRIQILHASDLEGGVDAIGDAPNFGAVVDALEQEAAGVGVESILLSAGDNYIPGPFFSAAGDFSLRATLRDVLGNPDARQAVGRVDVAIMNVLGFDAAAVGNHEFDAGTSVFESIIGPDIRDSDGDGVLDQPRWLGADFPYLTSNVDFSADGALAGLFTDRIGPNDAFAGTLTDLDFSASRPKLAPAAVVLRGGEVYAVIGATTPILETITSAGGATVIGPGAGTNDMAELAALIQPQIDRLAARGVDKFILVSHLQQLALEQQLVQLLDGIDIVVAGGSDTLLADSDDRLRLGDTAQGDYPLVTTDLVGNPALIVTTDGQYSYVGRLVVDFDAVGNVVPSSVITAESGAYAADAQGVADLWGVNDPFAVGSKGELVRRLTDAVSAVVTVKDSNIFGRTDVFIEGRRSFVRTQETNLGVLTADANLTVARSFDPTVSVSLKNGGGIRAAIGSIDGDSGALLPTSANPAAGKLAGDVSQLDIENTLRFNNGLTLITLTPAQLRQVLEHAVSATAPGATPGQFCQLGGIAFSYDPMRSPGARVINAGILDRTDIFPFLVFEGQTIGTEPIRIVTLDFLANGGDGYPYPDFVAMDPMFANRVDLETAGLSGGVASFAPAGTEQDALAEYFAQEFAATPYDVAETPVELDERIQDVLVRLDTVIFFVLSSFR